MIKGEAVTFGIIRHIIHINTSCKLRINIGVE